jgi:hypothetical protein
MPTKPALRMTFWSDSEPKVTGVTRQLELRNGEKLDVPLWVGGNTIAELNASVSLTPPKVDSAPVVLSQVDRNFVHMAMATSEGAA